MSDTITTLRRENAALRTRLDRFLGWEYRLNMILDREREFVKPVKLSALQLPQSKGASRFHVALKKPLTLEECHAIARNVYSDIMTFSTGGREGSISTGASVFGWKDERQINNGLLKFSLSKLNTRMSPEEVSAALWALSTCPDSHSSIHSQSLGMRTEIVQVVDHSNVVVWQEYQVHSNAGDVPTVTVVRAFFLLTMFATESGYILLTHGLDPGLANYSPNEYLNPLPNDNMIVRHEWLPMFSWCTMDRVEGAPNQCLSSSVGTFPVNGANFASWAVEVLLMVLRVENILLGPQLTIQQDTPVEYVSQL